MYEHPQHPSHDLHKHYHRNQLGNYNQYHPSFVSQYDNSEIIQLKGLHMYIKKKHNTISLCGQSLLQKM